jgi:hypothetical protein
LRFPRWDKDKLAILLRHRRCRFRLRWPDAFSPA